MAGRAAKLAVGTAGILAVGWLATALSSAVIPGGHPPMWYVAGAGVVLASFVIAPLGAGAALTALWRARRAGTGGPPLMLAMLSLNLLFLVIAVGLWFLFLGAATRR